jgi:hypothetical protein
VTYFSAHLFPFQSANAVATAAVRQYGRGFLERGGPIGRARAEFARGASLQSAVAVAARQGKGHVAELRLAAEHSLDCGLRGHDYHTAPNRLANDPHRDLEIWDRHGKVVNDAQVGVGSDRYLRRKILRSQARQVIVNSEAHDALGRAGDLAHSLSSDHLEHRGTSSGSLSGGRVHEEAEDILEAALLETPSVPEWFKVSISLSAAMSATVVTFARSLLVGAVERLHSGQPFDRSLVENAFRSGIPAFAKGGVQSYLLVNRFLGAAGPGFDGRLLSKLGKTAAVASAIAEVVVDTAMEVLACLRGEIDFAELCRRTLMAVVSAGGALLAFAVAARATTGLHPWLSMLLTALAALAGAHLARKGAEALLPPAARARTPSRPDARELRAIERAKSGAQARPSMLRLATVRQWR